MTVQHDFHIPTFQLGDRMALALRDSGHSVNDAAEYLGVNRHTVSRWLNGIIAPTLATQRLWALWTGVPLAWLQTGERPSTNDGDGLLLPRLDSNQEPAVNRFERECDEPDPFILDSAA